MIMFTGLLAWEYYDLHMKSRKDCNKTRSPPASLLFKGQGTEHTTVKWSIVSLTIFCVTCDFSPFFVMLIITKPDRVAFSRVHDRLSLKPFADFTKFAISPKSFRFACHFGISLSVQLMHVITQKPTQLFKYRLCYLKVRVIFVRFHCNSIFMLYLV